ncbi:feruloyl esteras-like protein B precursor [Cadophora sp. DSE1049]|nr:feruloyl esteras-like protein B precursor [Cadophora sp. DSE1049]
MSSALACVASAFSYPSLFGAQFLSLTAAAIQNFTVVSPQGDSHLARNLTGLEFCNVTISYTHPGQDDIVNVQIWLPTTWNGRFMGTGGGGYVTGKFAPSLGNAVSQGFSAGSTDGGHSANAPTASWALASPGNINWALVQDFASISLNDMTTIGKSITQMYYNKTVSYSYWSGCSTGGRQGLMMAQRYPDGYDGILAGAPAINWATFLVTEYYPQLIMNRLGIYPPPCELNAITAAAIEACDKLDGVADGVISLPQLCHFDPKTLVGKTFSCNGISSKFTQAGATVADAVWSGARSARGSFEWFGSNYDAPMGALAGTRCTGRTCTGTPFSTSTDWISIFIENNPEFNVAQMTRKEFDDILHKSRQRFGSIIDTSDPDLSQFRDLGGKLITWHGLADQLIFPEGTANYYDRVRAGDPSVTSYYRHFEAPGIYHCQGGAGAYPGDALNSLIDWVEKGRAPDVLHAKSVPASGPALQRDLCSYPLVQVYIGGDPAKASSFACHNVKSH